MDKTMKSLIKKALNLFIIIIISGSFIGVWPLLNLVPKGDKDALALPETAGNEGFSIIQGNSFSPTLKPAGTDLNVVQEINVVVTAYSSSVWETDNSPYITASGTFVKDGVAANNLLSFGTRIRMPEVYGNKVFVIEDRMNSKKGYYHVDIWFPSYLEAKNFGAKETYIEVIKES